jgi:hypothetical protein
MIGSAATRRGPISSKPQLTSTGLLHCSQLVRTLMVDIPRLRHSPPTQCYGSGR